MTDQMPKVTVLMSVYNGALFIKETIESILTQTFSDFEFLIINDGSIDDTKEIILSFNDKRIRLVENEGNIGLSKSLNKGLELSQGEYIARQDADDISEPERLFKQVSFFETHPEVALVGTWYKEIDAQGGYLNYGKLPCDHIQIRWHILFYCPFVHSAVMFRRSNILKKIGFYNEAFSYSMDYEFWLRIVHYLPVANLDEYLLRLRYNPHSMSATYGDKTLEGYKMRIANLGELLKWDKTQITFNKERFDNITSLLFRFGSQRELNFQEINRSVEDIFQLNAAFIRLYDINKKDSRNHNVKLQALLGFRLIELVKSHLCEKKYQRVQLVLKAYNIYWPVFFTQKNLSCILTLLT